jgi:hypothetical protein
MYPTAVLTTPGCRQKILSAPQKQPIPTYINWVPTGHGGTVGVPSTACTPRTFIGVSRPGRADSAVGIAVLLEKNPMLQR